MSLLLSLIKLLSGRHCISLFSINEPTKISHDSLLQQFTHKVAGKLAYDNSSFNHAIGITFLHCIHQSTSAIHCELLGSVNKFLCHGTSFLIPSMHHPDVLICTSGAYDAFYVGPLAPWCLGMSYQVSLSGSTSVKCLHNLMLSGCRAQLHPNVIHSTHPDGP